jgi:hypothetical protein
MKLREPVWTQVTTDQLRGRRDDRGAFVACFSAGAASAIDSTGKFPREYTFRLSGISPDSVYSGWMLQRSNRDGPQH